MPLRARRLLRRMRGGAQAHLVEADDDHCYVVKFKNNPQHRRILINELMAGVFLRYLKISTPATAIIEITEDFLRREPDAGIQLGERRVPPEPGWCFGSRFPEHPERVAVYDFLPDSLLATVANLHEFPAALVFDKWAGNADARQAVFRRVQLREWLRDDRSGLPERGFVALMIDHGYVFSGPQWTFVESPLQGLYHRPTVYARVRGWEDFQPWLDWVVNFPEKVVDEAWGQIPRQWLDGDEDALEKLLNRLMARRKRVPDLIRDTRNARHNPFPNWH